jgi:uncharacterized protein (DUF1810 family)
MAGMSDEAPNQYRLDRFVAAQDRGGRYQRAVAELHAREKASHWMWFVFPQIAGLGHSETARLYAIGSLGEARAYLAHPVLGLRLRQCARIVADTEGRTAEQVFGPVDAMKLRSSMTLFAAADDDPGQSVFRAVLAKYFDGVPDEATTSRLLRLADRGSRRTPAFTPSRRPHRHRRLMTAVEPWRSAAHFPSVGTAAFDFLSAGVIFASALPGMRHPNR